MRKYIDKFWIFWSKLSACWQLLTQSKTTTWVVLFDEIDKEGNRSLTYATEQTANVLAVYNLIHTALINTGGIVIRGLKNKNPLAVDMVEKNLATTKECAQMFNKMLKVAEGDVQTITNLVKQN
jgi:hypothetical protein